jgi:hypothetical protein
MSLGGRARNSRGGNSGSLLARVRSAGGLGEKSFTFEQNFATSEPPWPSNTAKRDVSSELLKPASTM